MKLEVVKGSAGITGKAHFFQTKTRGLVKVLSGGQRTKQLQIVSIAWEEKTTRSVGKSAAGAIGGGLLAGPIGLILGAAVGAKKKEVSTAVIVFEEGIEIIVRLTAKDYELLASW